VLAWTVGPAPSSDEKGTWIYRSHLRSGGPVKILAIEPGSGRVRSIPPVDDKEMAVWALGRGSDGAIYAGTLPGGRLWRLDHQTGRFVDLGRAAPGEQYLWELASATDGRLYMGTYPGGKLIAYDPKERRFFDLGRPDPDAAYARQVVAGDDGFVYVSTGPTPGRVIAFEIKTGTMRRLLSWESLPATWPRLWKTDSGRVLTAVGDRCHRLSGFSAEPLPIQDCIEAGPRLPDGRHVRKGTAAELVLHSVATGKEQLVPLEVPKQTVPLLRFAAGPDGALYMSGGPLYLMRLDPRSGRCEVVGWLGEGQAYQLTTHHGQLLIGAYSALASLMSYVPGRPFHPGPSPTDNPRLTVPDVLDQGWRPKAMLAVGEHVFVGAEGGYGKTEGVLVRWDPARAEAVTRAGLEPGQSIASLAWASGMLVAGTSHRGGNAGSSKGPGRLLVLSNDGSKVLGRVTPDPEAADVGTLVALADGALVGLAGARNWFRFDPRRLEITATRRAPFEAAQAHDHLFNAAVLGPDGAIWGLVATGIYRVDPKTLEAELVFAASKPITAGIALVGRDLYFAQEHEVYRARIPGAAKKARSR
jgi:streptogramin lyase